jgi:predicted ATPase
VSSQLRDLQDRISHYQGRFRAAGRDDIAEDLEKCIHLLMNAADVAVTLDIKGSD